MNVRRLSILITALLAGTAAGFALLGKSTLAAPPPGMEDALAEPEAAVANEEHLPATPADGAWSKSAMGPARASDVREDTSGWTKGVIRGDVTLAVSVLDRLGSMTVIVEEVRSAFANDGSFERPRKYMEPVERGQGTPTFEVRNVEFSEYPYRVSLRAAGLNGSTSTVTVNAETPLHDVELKVTPGAPFSVLLRDQDGGPHPDVDLLLMPVGEPAGRPRLKGTSDNFGTVIYEDVLAGPYELHATKGGLPFGEPETVDVQPGRRNYNRKIQGQGHTMIVPRGVQVDVTVHDRAGYGIENVKVTATATDRRRLVEYAGTTDALGRLRFPHLVPGKWQLTAELTGFQRVDQSLILEPDQQPVQRSIKLVPPLRRR